MDAEYSSPSSELRLSAVLRASIGLAEEMETQLLAQIRRANEAEGRLTAAERTLDDVRRDLEAVRFDYEGRIERMQSALHDYVLETGRAHQELVALARRILTIASGDQTHRPGADSRSVPATDPSERVGHETAGPDPVPAAAPFWHPTTKDPDTTSAPAGGPEAFGGRTDHHHWAGRYAATSLDAAGEDEVTDEHRIIDARNELDLRRLDSVSFVQAFRSRA